MKKVLTMIVALVLVLGLAACSSGITEATSSDPTINVSDETPSISMETEGTSAEAEKTTLRLGVVSDFKARQEALTLISDPLVGLDDTYSATPWLIKDWTINEDATEYTLYLQEGVTFSDGTPFNAEVCKYNLEALGALYYCSYVYALDSIEVVDDYTLTVHFTSTTLSFMEQIFKICALPIDSVDENGNIINFIGTGPFILTDYEENVEATLERNDEYWYAERMPKVTKVKWLVIGDADARVLALESDQVDVIGYTEHSSDLPHSSIASFEGKDGYNLTEEDPEAYISVISIGMNWTREPLKDQALRSAMEYAVNREELAETVFFGAANACGHMTNPTFTDGSDQVDAFTYDVDKAMEILDEAGYVLENGILKKDGTPIELEYVTTTSTEDKDFAVYIQSNLKEIGITVNITALENEQAAERMKSGDYNLAKGAYWFEPTVNALSFYGLEDEHNPMGSYGGLGYGVNSEVTTLGQTLLIAKNSEELQKAANDFWQANYEACPTIPIVTWYRTAIYNDNFAGFNYNNNYFVIDLSEVTVK